MANSLEIKDSSKDSLVRSVTIRADHEAAGINWRIPARSRINAQILYIQSPRSIFNFNRASLKRIVYTSARP